MNIVQQKLVESYTVLVIANEMNIEDVPEFRVIRSEEYPIRSEVNRKVAERISN